MDTSSPPVRTGADVACGLLLLVLDGVISLCAAVFLALRGWSGPPDPRSSAPPPMDWTPVITFGVITGVVLLIAWAMLRGGWAWTAGGQFLAAGLLCLVTLLIAAEEWTTAHPGAADTPAAASLLPLTGGAGQGASVGHGCGTESSRVRCGLTGATDPGFRTTGQPLTLPVAHPLRRLPPQAFDRVHRGGTPRHAEERAGERETGREPAHPGHT
ncbi:DUF6234 family protein [Streptomyces sp. NPDC056222]|uniref:DUF6234 family protein n=1 Tax=Streptomyces sp. NPDC056222 TaxID=3345749 RepID=UPI0035DE4F75